MQQAEEKSTNIGTCPHLPRALQLPWSKPVSPPAGSAWSCPPVRFICAMHNPPNQCLVDRHCPRGKKCCQSFCGRKCLSKPPAIPVTYGRSSAAPNFCWGKRMKTAWLHTCSVVRGWLGGENPSRGIQPPGGGSKGKRLEQNMTGCFRKAGRLQGALESSVSSRPLQLHRAVEGN
uniref:Uncharacterized protein n=1 Tax=Corvus moneduloides TaxID=1196302 RepID=A0A8C3DCE8_CORMO